MSRTDLDPTTLAASMRRMAGDGSVEWVTELVRDMWRGSVTRMDFADRYAFIGEFVDRMRELKVVDA